MTSYPARLSVLILLTLLMTACGFQLRGTGSSTLQLPSSISPVYISGLAVNDDLRRELTGLIRSDTVEVTDNVDESTSTLRISDSRSDRRVLAIDGSGKVVEFELFEALRFDMTERNGSVLVTRQDLSITRSFLNADILVLGKLEEEASLRKGMRRDMASQIVARLVSRLK